MFRLFVCGVLAGAMSLAWNGSASAQMTRAETCTETAKIVQIATTLRAKGSKKNTTQRSLTEGKNKVEDRFTVMVAPLVNWIYTIDDAVIAQPGGPRAVAENYHKECMSYQQ